MEEAFCSIADMVIYKEQMSPTYLLRLVVDVPDAPGKNVPAVHTKIRRFAKIRFGFFAREYEGSCALESCAGVHKHRAGAEKSWPAEHSRCLRRALQSGQKEPWAVESHLCQRKRRCFIATVASERGGDSTVEATPSVTLITYAG
jgi:hypothetical protein